MPTKTKNYDRVIFTPEVIKETVDTLVNTLPENERVIYASSRKLKLLSGESWQYDSEEFFFADYRKGFVNAFFEAHCVVDMFPKVTIDLSVIGENTEVKVRMPKRADVESVFSVLESNLEKCRLPELTPKVKIFIGHGHDTQWRDLKDHLHEKHGLDVEAYELGARAGLTIKEVLDNMSTKSSIALLVLTGEDQDTEGKLHARENVVHELGLFQGRLGWRRAIALLEEGVSEFSNIHGLAQIRFSKGNIQETFGEVLATIRREFSGK